MFTHTRMKCTYKCFLIREIVFAFLASLWHSLVCHDPYIPHRLSSPKKYPHASLFSGVNPNTTNSQSSSCPTLMSGYSHTRPDACVLDFFTHCQMKHTYQLTRLNCGQIIQSYLLKVPGFLLK